MRTRLLTLAVIGGLAVAALPADAATAMPQITDPAGDANGVNDQGLVSGGPAIAASGPADLSQADITSVQFATTFVTKTVKGRRSKVATGFTVTMNLAAAPSVPDLFYRVAATSTSCETLFFEYSTAPNDTEPGSARCAAALPNPSGPIPVKSVAVKGNAIIWSVPLTSVPKNTVLSGLDAQTRGTAYASTPVFSGGPTVPQFDYASTKSTFTVGR
jgi:hypothetical protein